MELIKFIEKNGEEKLHELGIHFYKYGDLTVYQYSQIESFLLNVILLLLSLEELFLITI